MGFVIGICLIIGYAPIESTPLDERLLVVSPDQSVRIRRNVTPGSALKYQDIVKQTYDYSCGSAALSTLLKYRLGECISEPQVIRGLLTHGDREQIVQKRAFSLLDMKKYVNALGYDGAGYRAEIEDLKNPDNWPLIVPVTLFDYRHFVILKGVHDGHVFIADPFSGNSSYPLYTFKTMWYDKVVFIVSPKGGKGLKALKLENQDLRYITESDAKRAIMNRYPAFDTPSNVKMSDFSGQKHYFKP